MCDARALKNRLRIISLRDVVNLYREFSQVDQTQNLYMAFKDCLASERKTTKFLEQIRELCDAAAPLRGMKNDAETIRMKKELSHVKQLEYLAGSECLRRILPMYHYDLRGTSSQWHIRNIF